MCLKKPFSVDERQIAQNIWIRFTIKNCDYIALNFNLSFRKIMRVVGEIPHPQLKITSFNWNNRYLIKLEAGALEQTFKVSEMDVTSEEDLKKMIDTEFLKEAEARFHEMAQSLFKSQQRNEEF